MEQRPSPASLRSAPSPASGRGEAGGLTEVSSPLPQAGEGGAKRRVRGYGKKPDATIKARSLRKASTEPEQRLWRYLRNRHLDGHRFSRQYPIGPYFADFVCREAWLVVELDGSQHAESRRDIERDRFINVAGYSVLRFWNEDVTENLDGVMQVLRAVLDGNPSPGWRYAPATLSRRAGEGKSGE